MSLDFLTSLVFKILSFPFITEDASPAPMYYPTTVPYGDSFVLIGGYNPVDAVYLSTIYFYDPIDQSFKLRERLRVAKSFPGAVMVDSMSFPECD